ncbi:MAG: hypothetical protein JXR63_11420 [Spirochaetales bacterium]|nr:hypothetical protein [Spirochaetales bacterium]
MKTIVMEKDLIVITILDIWEKVKKELLSKRKKDRGVILDFKDVVKMDGAGIQFLLFMLKEKERGEIPVDIKNIPEKISKSSVVLASGLLGEEDKK